VSPLRGRLAAVVDWLADHPEVTPLGVEAGPTLLLDVADFGRVFRHARHETDTSTGVSTGRLAGVDFVARGPRRWQPADVDGGAS
jgi:hypothetical protein